MPTLSVLTCALSILRHLTMPRLRLCTLIFINVRVRFWSVVSPLGRPMVSTLMLVFQRGRSRMNRRACTDASSSLTEH